MEPPVTDAPILELRGVRGEEIVDVLCDAFHDYPVMHHVIGDSDYDARLRRLVGVFVAARVLSRHPMYAIEAAGRLVAAGTTTPPGAGAAPPEFPALRDAVWKELGEEALARYRALVAVWESVPFPEPHLHLNMLGTRRSHAGRGFGRRILEAVQDASRRAATRGVSLSTEDPRNVPLYEHCGYRVLHHARVTDSLETWLLFRENPSYRAEDRGAEVDEDRSAS
jgi:GNAT superfamily N-acetyltransferase